MRKFVSFFCLLVFLSSLGTASAASHHRHRHRASGASAAEKMDLSPISVQPFVVPAAADQAEATFHKKMNLENGALVHGTRWIEPGQVSSRDLFLLQITQSLEGGFDSVNMYDKGVASWGIMQWSAHEGSLAGALTYIKRRLLVAHEEGLWNKLFTSNGMDVNSDGLILYGKPVTDAASARLAFRGTSKIGSYDPKLVNHWATVLARAGRQPAIQALEVEYASHIVDDVLDKRLGGLPYHGPGRAGLTASDLADNDPYAEALVFALWTNNPRHAFEYVEDAAWEARAVSICDDPGYWAPGAFSHALLRRCLSSRFGNWQERAAMIEARAEQVRSAPAANLTPFEAQYQQVLAERKARRFVEMASRHSVEERGVSPAMELAQVKRANAALAQFEGKMRPERTVSLPISPSVPPMLLPQADSDALAQHLMPADDTSPFSQLGPN